MNFNRRGFTLVELFLVAALTGIVMLAISSSYISGIRIWRSVKELRLTEDSKIFIAMEKIKRELKGYIRDFGEIPLEGDDRELSFSSLSGLQIVKVTYYFDAGRKGLFKKVVKFSDSLKDKMKEKKTRLFDARDVRFDYFFYKGQEEEGDYWIKEFTEEKDGLPQVVRFTIKRDGEEFAEHVFIPY